MNNPLVSLCILTYNQEDYIRETLEGAVSQDYDNLEIIVSDDNSKDNTFKIIEEFASQYKGPHKLIINRNEPNLGLVPHLNKVLFELSHGEYIMLAGGDDISLPNRTKDSLYAIQKACVDSMSMNMSYIDSKSAPMNKTAYPESEEIKTCTIEDYINNVRTQMPGASRMITRRLLDTFGPFNSDCQTEDTTSNFRAMLLSGTGCYMKTGVLYRRHDNNLSNTSSLLSRFDPQKITNQYQNDLNTAKDKGLVSEEQYIKVQNNLNHYLDYEEIKRMVYNKKVGILPFIKLILSAKFNKKEKRTLIGLYRRYGK